jgi:hypothetical protein
MKCDCHSQQIFLYQLEFWLNIKVDYSQTKKLTLAQVS